VRKFLTLYPVWESCAVRYTHPDLPDDSRQKLTAEKPDEKEDRDIHQHQQDSGESYENSSYIVGS